MAQDRKDEDYLRTFIGHEKKRSYDQFNSGEASTEFESGQPSTKFKKSYGGLTSNQVKFDDEGVPTNRFRPDLPEIDKELNPHLSTAPFIHPSVVPDTHGPTSSSAGEPKCYESLEFIGDAYLELMATEFLFHRYPNLPVGKKSAIRETMVRNDILAKFTKWYKWDLYENGEGIKVDPNTRKQAKTGVWTKILADVFEAYVGAVVLSDEEKGYDRAKEWLKQLWEAFGLVHTEKEANATLTDDLRAAKDLQLAKKGKETEDQPPKDILGSLITDQGNKPEYRLDWNRPPQASVTIWFSGYGYWKDVKLGHAVGEGKKQAGQAAALNALRQKESLINEVARVKWNRLKERRTLKGGAESEVIENEAETDAGT